MRNLLERIIDDTLAALKQKGALKLEVMPTYGVDPPKNAAHGDLSCNVAMVLAKSEGQPPRKIAEAIVANVVDTAGVMQKIDIAGPGFLNVVLNDAVVQRVAKDVLVAGEAWGRAPKHSTGKRVMVEFVSANPTGPVHIGHARGAFTGDAVARVLDAAGHDVVREFYINDFGKQVETLGRTVFKRYQQLFGIEAQLAEGEYPAEYVVDIAKKLKDEDGDRWLNSGDWLPRTMEIAIRENMAAIRKTLARANIAHDVFSSEASLHKNGKVVGVVDHYRKVGATYEADRAHGTDDKVRREDSKAANYEDKQLGGTFLMTSKYGDEEDRIILRKDNTPVYLTADLAYHKDKLDRGFHRLVDVFGADHAGHVPRIKAGVKLLGFDEQKQTLDFVLVQMVRITDNGQEVKLSKRKGTVLELDDLIEEVGADACRFLFLMRTSNAQLDFDLALAKKQSADNPVFYFQYGHARCAQILKKATEQGRSFVGAARIDDKHLAKLVLPEERALLKKMAFLPEVVVSAADALEPHRVLSFCGELIADFHGYYTKYKKTERVLSDDEDKTQGRLALIAALKQTLKNAFAILGVAAPDYMAQQEDQGDGQED